MVEAEKLVLDKETGRKVKTKVSTVIDQVLFLTERFFVEKFSFGPVTYCIETLCNTMELLTVIPFFLMITLYLLKAFQLVQDWLDQIKTVAFSPYVLSVRRTSKNNAIDIFFIYITQNLKILPKTLIFFHKIAKLYSKMQEY